MRQFFAARIGRSTSDDTVGISGSPIDVGLRIRLVRQGGAAETILG